MWLRRSGPQAGGRSRTRRDFPLSVKIHSGIRTRPLPSASKAENWPCELFLAARPLRQLLAVTVGGGIAVLSVSVARANVLGNLGDIARKYT